MYMSNLRSAVVAIAVLCGTALPSGNASAMPVNGLANAAAQMATDVQNVTWVCGPFRCWWRPSYHPYYGYAWGGPRVYARPWWRYRYARPWWGGRYAHRWGRPGWY